MSKKSFQPARFITDAEDAEWNRKTHFINTLVLEHSCYRRVLINPEHTLEDLIEVRRWLLYEVAGEDLRSKAREVDEFLPRRSSLLPDGLRPFLMNHGTPFPLNEVVGMLSCYISEIGAPFRSQTEPDWAERLQARIEAILQKASAPAREVLAVLRKECYGLHPALAAHAAWVEQKAPKPCDGDDGPPIPKGADSWIDSGKALDMLVKAFRKLDDPTYSEENDENQVRSAARQLLLDARNGKRIQFVKRNNRFLHSLKDLNLFI
ncbi:MAG: hypothetical protein RBU21_09280 [FCB group bacterium]|jgi:hypothetical protein|nr:hypothetical protein [FCB group bacterium]